MATCAIQQITCRCGRNLNLNANSSAFGLTFEPNQLGMHDLLYSGTDSKLIPTGNTLDNLKRLGGVWHSPWGSANIWSKAIKLQATASRNKP